MTGFELIKLIESKISIDIDDYKVTFMNPSPNCIYMKIEDIYINDEYKEIVIRLEDR